MSARPFGSGRYVLTTGVALAPLAPLGNFIGHVVPVSTDEEMGWIAAPGVITGMAHHHSAWDRAVSQFPSHTVSADAVTVAPERPIPTREFTPAPFPAPVRLLDLRPEALLPWNAATQVIRSAGALPTTKCASIRAPKVSRWGREFDAAMLADRSHVYGILPRVAVPRHGGINGC